MNNKSTVQPHNLEDAKLEESTLQDPMGQSDSLSAHGNAISMIRLYTDYTEGMIQLYTLHWSGWLGITPLELHPLDAENE